MDGGIDAKTNKANTWSRFAKKEGLRKKKGLQVLPGSQHSN
ncbi:MAG: hypothetical protein H6Q53_55 [Deltaproteobacteria bacterium]|nr:hypothetical protein [Deltaproteobacteria bacterium]